MKQKEIITQIPEGFEIDKENSTFEKIVLREIKNKYPLSVGEIKNRDWYISSLGDTSEANYNTVNQLSTQARAEAFLALMQLVELRDACNEIDGGKEWDCEKYNSVIIVFKNDIVKTSYRNLPTVLHFRKESTRDWFLETHRELIETAKELI